MDLPVESFAIIGRAVTAGGYLFIGAMPAVFIVQEKPKPGPWRNTLWLFAAFILSCAADHFAHLMTGGHHTSGAGLFTIIDGTIVGVTCYTVWTQHEELARRLRDIDRDH